MGNPRLGLCILGISMATNVILNYGLIFGRLGLPEMGIEGAALATLIARMLQLVLAVGHGVVSRWLWPVPIRLLRPGVEMLRRFIRFATPVVLNETLWGLGTALYPTIMGHMDGSQAILAAYAVAGNVEKLCTVVIFAVANASAVIIGQSVVRESRERVMELGRVLNTVAVLAGAIGGALALGVLYLFVEPLVFPKFHLSALAQSVALMMLTITFIMFPLRSYNTTNIVGVLRGGGDVSVAAVIDLAFLWVLAIPLSAFVGLILRWDIFWVYAVQALEQTVKVCVGWWRMRSGKWVRDVTVSA